MRIGRATGTLELMSKADDITKRAAKPFLKALNQRIRNRLPQLVEAIREHVKRAILASEEVQAIIGDDNIRGQLGLPNPRERWEAIANAVAESVLPIFRPFRSVNGNAVSGRLEIFAAPKNNRNLFELAEAYVGGENAEMFPWLKALLEAGDEIFIAGYQYTSRILSPETLARVSRTGQGVMLKRAGKGWRVPPEVSGTENNNLLTRALNSPEMYEVIQRELVKLLRG